MTALTSTCITFIRFYNALKTTDLRVSRSNPAKYICDRRHNDRMVEVGRHDWRSSGPNPHSGRATRTTSCLGPCPDWPSHISNDGDSTTFLASLCLHRHHATITSLIYYPSLKTKPKFNSIKHFLKRLC